MAADSSLLILGSGAAEHALARHLAGRSQTCWVAPGNAGAAALPGARTAPVDLRDGEALVALARRVSASAVFVNDPAALPWGAVDHLRAFGLPVFGAPILAARLEASKRFAHAQLEAAGLPTLEGRSFERYVEAKAAAAGLAPESWVVKPDGRGPRASVCFPETPEALLAAFEAGLVLGRFGDAGRRMRLERRASGPVACAVGLMGPKPRFLAGARLLDRLPPAPKAPGAGFGAWTLPENDPAGLSARLAADFARFAEHLNRSGLGYSGFLELRALQDEGGAWRYFGALTHLSALAGVVALEATEAPAELLLAALPGAPATGQVPLPRALSCAAVAYAAFPNPASDPASRWEIGGLEAAGRLPDTAVLHERTDAPDGAGSRLTVPQALTVVGRGASRELASHHARRALTALEIGGEPATYHRDLG